MMQVGKLVKVFVYIKGKRIEVEPDEARALLAQLKAAVGDEPASRWSLSPSQYSHTTEISTWAP